MCRRSVICGSFLGLVVVAVLSLTYHYRDQSGEEFYSCANSSVCIPQPYVCNSYRDCPYGDDESVPVCVNMRGDLGLLNKHFLSKSAHANSSVNYTLCELDFYPDGCSCRNTKLFCSRMTLKQVPQNVSANVTRMVLRENQIKLDSDSFSSFNLQRINLADNNLTDVPPGVFRGQSKLTRLNLMRNNLKCIRHGVLNGLDHLEWFFISFNQLTDFDMANFEGLSSLEWIDLSYNNLSLEGKMFPHLPHLTNLWLEYNIMRDISKMLLQELDGLTTLLLSNNKIETIDKDAFRNQAKLLELDLSKNAIIALDYETFVGPHNLDKLSLENNYQMQHVTGKLFTSLVNLTSLNLEGIDIEDIDMTTFASMTKLQFLNLKSYYYCTYAPKVTKCQPKTDGVSTLKNLLGKSVFRVTVWMVSATNCLGNILVLWGRFTARDENKVLSFVIKNLAMADFLMGVYLAVIGSSDNYYRDVFNDEAHNWMSSWTCTLIGILAMISSEVSVLILVFMSLERFLSIAVPFSGQPTLTIKTAYTSLILIWCVGILVAVAPVAHWHHSRGFYGTNSMCFPLHVDDPYLPGWEYSAFVFLGINLASLALIVVLYSGMFFSIYQTRHATALGGVADLEFAFRFFFIVLTDALCWAPIITIKILALARVAISSDVYAWMVVFVLPVNSAINPLLYTFTTPKYLGKLVLGGGGRWAHARRRLIKRRPSTANTECSRSSSNRNVLSLAGAKVADGANPHLEKAGSAISGDQLLRGSMIPTSQHPHKTL